MTLSGYINSKEALEVLGLYNPANGGKPNVRHLKNLEKRGLLKRYVTNPRNISYRKIECENLFNKAIKEGILLTLKP